MVLEANDKVVVRRRTSSLRCSVLRLILEAWRVHVRRRSAEETTMELEFGHMLQQHLSRREQFEFYSYFIFILCFRIK